MPGALVNTLLAYLSVHVAAFGDFGIPDDELVASIQATYVNGILAPVAAKTGINGTGSDITTMWPYIDDGIELMIYSMGDGRVYRMSGKCGVRAIYSQAFRQLGATVSFTNPVDFPVTPFQVNARSKTLMAGFGGDGGWHWEGTSVVMNDDGTKVISVVSHMNFTYLYADPGCLFMEDPDDLVAGSYDACSAKTFGYYVQNPGGFPVQAPSYLC